MPRLSDFGPAWIDAAPSAQSAERRGLGVSFRCPAGHCQGRCWVLFANPLDGGPPYERDCFDLMMEFYESHQDPQSEGPIHDRGCGKVRWLRGGETFDDLTLTPSLDMHGCGHFFLTAGGW